ncbi:MAG: ComEC/Rec2 family competence protein [Clostridia bacterium]|nr:ComEC/Rec2 family competence protein [Clostridia bacterium]
MKRPFAVIGFSMLAAFLVVTNITHKMTIALLAGAVVIFSCLIIIKSLRKCQFAIFSLAGVILFTTLFISAESHYLSEVEEMRGKEMITGVVCETPKDTDYSATYVVKVDDESYKVRFSSGEDHFIEEGDCVRIRFSEVEEPQADFLSGNLASKIYFTFFGGDNCTIEKTGEENLYYKHLGDAKRWFTEVIMKYLPGENGAIAIAMVIGDKTEIEEKVVDWFNYSGTSHLLVISGLHLTMWSVGIMSFLDRNSRLRRYSPYIGLLCLLGYSAITGFTVSVIRAGMMVGMVLVGRILKRDSDSINSVGGAVALILIKNPFAPGSLALWLSVLSTLGMLAYSGKVQSWLYRKSDGTECRNFPFKDTLFTTIAISFATAVFTLPVFIFKLKLLPIATIIANFIMVSVAMMLMYAAVAGAIAHVLFLYPVARTCYFITGLCGKILYYTSEKIGMADWSTVSVEHDYYKVFFFVLVLGVVFVLGLQKRKINVLKLFTIIMATAFLITSVYCVSYEYNTPSVEVMITDSNPVIVVTSKRENVLVGVQKKKHENIIKDMINRHNEKKLDNVFILKTDSKSIAEISYLQYAFDADNLFFYDDCPAFYSENYVGNVENILISGSVKVNAVDTDCIEIFANNRSALITDCKNTELVYENAKKYDIIIIYGKYIDNYVTIIDSISKQTQVVYGFEDEQLSFYLE